MEAEELIPVQPPESKEQASENAGYSSKKESLRSEILCRLVPKTNKFFFVISVVFVFGIDLIILIMSPSLWFFWAEMLLVFGIFYLFYSAEKNVAKSKFAQSKSNLDTWIYMLVVIRNIVIFLNFIPFIQVIGMMVGMFLVVPYSIVYLVITTVRAKKRMRTGYQI